jgi:Ca-activated chloride channel family protein
MMQRFAAGFVALCGLPLAGQATFSVSTRLVEVYATVWDHRGHYLDGLTQDRFEVRDNGEVQPVVAFESNSTNLSCAILLDTTGSMTAALPIVKNSVIKMIQELRENDAVAIYTFSTGLNRLQEFTTDKAGAKQAVLRARAAGMTALFDSISMLAREVAPRSGKKAIIVFTDGADNSSTLNAAAAIRRTKSAGVPVYTIAEGEALRSKSLLEQLKEISRMTGGQSHRAGKTSDIAEIFHEISGDLQHTYMLAYKPPASPNQTWRTIDLRVAGLKDCKIRSKEGYVPE